MVMKLRWEGSMSWSKLDVFETCAARFYWQYVEKRPEPPSQALIKGSRVHNNLDLWLNGKHPALPLEALPMRVKLNELKVLKPRTEEEWAFDEGMRPLQIGFTKADRLRAKIDALVKMTSSAHVIDFKTGKMRGAKGEQTRFYGTLTLIMEPRVQIVYPEYWYVEHNVLAEGEPVHRKELPSLKVMYMRRLAKPGAEKKWTPTPGVHCRWCSFSKERGGPCPAA